jgi:hypothetical protein
VISDRVRFHWYASSCHGIVEPEPYLALLNAKSMLAMLPCIGLLRSGRGTLESRIDWPLPNGSFRPKDTNRSTLWSPITASTKKEEPQLRGAWDRLWTFMVPTLHAQSATYYGDGGSMTAISWDDGDHSTWEGTLIFQDNQGNYAALDTQLRNDTDHLNSFIVFETNGSHTPPANPPPNDPYAYRWEGIGEGLPCTSWQVPMKINQNVARDSWWKIAGSLIGCAATGPKYWACVGLGGTAIVVGHGMQNLGSFSYYCIWCPYMGYACP